MFESLTLYIYFEVEKDIHVLEVMIGTLEDSGGSWLGLDILILNWLRTLVYKIPMSLILAVYPDFKSATNIYILWAQMRALEDTQGSWLGFGILILIYILSLCFATPMIQILALYRDIEGAKNIYIL